MSEIIKAIILGIVQGITEWLPISSTGHMILVDELMPMQLSKDFMDLFMVVIQFGSILAVCILYFHKLNPFSLKKTAKQRKDTWVLWSKVLIASVPVAIVGLLLDDIIHNALYNAVTVAVALIVYGILFIVIENRRSKPRMTDVSEVTYAKAAGIGCFQMLALIPGTSRSGSTILGATLLGCSREVAAEFSFFMAIPAMVGASGIKLLKYFIKVGVGFSAIEWAVLLIGSAVAFFVSVAAIKFLMSYIKKHDFKAFGWYRIVLGIIVLVYFLLWK